ncbi:MAG: hypothetical protein IPN51_03530 [Chloracidobacterium sp.]|nr:hypothetical protein [Chloracidobacterium sp.]
MDAVGTKWIDEYSEGHQHLINKLTHQPGIPMIALAILMVPASFFFSGPLAVRFEHIHYRVDLAVHRTLS